MPFNGPAVSPKCFDISGTSKESTDGQAPAGVQREGGPSEEDAETDFSMNEDEREALRLNSDEKRSCKETSERRTVEAGRSAKKDKKAA